MDLKETNILGADIEQHWYYSSKAKAIMSLLEGNIPVKILDIGAGSGFFSHHILGNTSAQEAWCVDISYDADSDENKSGKRVHYRRTINAIDADLVLVMDLLEHVDNDVALLKEYMNKVPHGSRFIITVPAFKFLWSGHDEFLEHKRRYTLKELEAAVGNAGLEVKLGGYYFGMVFPIAATIRLIQKVIVDSKSPRSQMTRHHHVVNIFMKILCNIELHFMRFNKIAGLTVFCVAKKV